MRSPALPLSYVRIRVTATATLAALVVAVAGSFLFVTSMRNQLEQGLVTAGEQQVQTVQAQLDAGESPDQAVISGKNDILVQIVDSAGTVIATDHPRVTSPIRTKPGAANTVHVRGLSDAYVVVARPEKEGNRLIVVGYSSEGIDRATDAAQVLLGVSVPVGLGLLAVVVWLSVGRGLRPVEAMRVEASAMTSAHSDRRLAVTGGDDEIPRLARTLNEMLDRIDASQRLQRQFVSDASHELRSPLAALRQVAEIARAYPEDADSQELARDVLAEEARMEELVTALLLLARLDDTAAPDTGPIDLDDVVMDEVRVARAIAPATLRLDASNVGGAQVQGDPVLLARVLRNLLSNAVRHAREQVYVSLAESDGMAVLTVEDDGNGILPEERGRIFERFVRLDESRARDDGGSGLGLAIVDKIVSGLGGNVSVGESSMGGAGFVVSLPMDEVAR
ncbi:MAG: ATP-binding region, ATPase domain protein [Marmoricola sp.]|nr:ATP-binding region, ATPase domain protein [Marmoricola sp.]